MKTKVIFRKEYPENGGEIIAVFPNLAGDMNPWRTCAYYAHFGQHGTMAVNYFYDTFPAKPEEYQDLQKELESLGYDLRICKRMTRKDLDARKQQTLRNP